MNWYLLLYVYYLFHFYCIFLFFFFFNDTATTEIYTLSLHDALPIFRFLAGARSGSARWPRCFRASGRSDRKSTRLNSSHPSISYAVFCLKKKKYHMDFFQLEQKLLIIHIQMLFQIHIELFTEFSTLF